MADTVRRSSLYISNWSLAEPLCQSQTLPYLRGLARRGHRSCVVTFERAPYAIAGPDISPMKARLAEAGICWHPLPFHSRVRAVAAAYDGCRALMAAAAALFRHRARIIQTRTSVPAAFGLALSAVSGRPFLYDADSELSEEYADGGYWSRRGWKFRALAWVEKTARRRAHAIIVLSDRLRRAFVERGVHAPITVIPCCVDTNRFRFDAVTRTARRRDLGIGDEKLFVYAGKTGPRYRIDEMMRFMAAAGDRIGPTQLLVLTHDEPAAFEAAAARAGVDRRRLAIRRAAPEEIPGWLWAADAGLAFFNSVDSERGSSPIKVSEYLAAGLPVVITRGIGDQSDVIEQQDLGVVVAEDSDGARCAAASRLAALWREPEPLRERCAQWARATLDVETVGVARYENVYQALLQ